MKGRKKWDSCNSIIKNIFKNIMDAFPIKKKKVNTIRA